ncbi:hypothetical protein BDQ17DRAFT_1411807 [Cyathus striatus]|nr:hypothetical protein BDQ17DRAFT_1411807 [Cyathus striatus]
MPNTPRRTQSLSSAFTGAPNALVDPVAWNSFLETHIKDEDDNREAIEHMFNGGFGQNMELLSLLLTFMRYNTRRLVDYQRVLSEAYQPDFFEPNWKRSSSSVRRRHMLEGLVRSRIVDPEAEADRIYCSELTLDAMDKQQGVPFINLVKRYIAPDVSKLTPDTTLSFPHPLWADEMKREHEKDKNSLRSLMWKFVQLNRDLYLCTFISGTYGSSRKVPRPPPTTLIKPHLADRRTINKQISDTMQRFGHMMDNDTFKQVNRQWKASVNAASRECEYCCKIEEPKDPLKRCQRCLANVQRRVYYCSSECQKKDWLVHKKICGKPLTIETANNISVSAFQERAVPPGYRTRFGPPEAGIIRSPALKNQICYLNHPSNAHVDYILFSPSDKAYHVIIWNDDILRTAFDDARHAAFILDKERFIVRLAQHLIRRGISMTGVKDLTEKDIQDQLQAEFPSCPLSTQLASLDRTTPTGQTALEYERSSVLAVWEVEKANRKRALKKR